jgi:hypothetical protein
MSKNEFNDLKLRADKIKLNNVYLTKFGQALLIENNMTYEEKMYFLNPFGAYEKGILTYKKLKTSLYCLLFPNNYKLPVFQEEEYLKIPSEYNLNNRHNAQFWYPELGQYIYELNFNAINIDYFSSVTNFNRANIKDFPTRIYSSGSLRILKREILRLTNYFHDIKDSELINLLSFSNLMPKNENLDDADMTEMLACNQLNLSSPFNKYREKYLLFFHNNDTINFFLIQAFCKTNAIEIILLQNLEGDDESNNFLAIFEKIPSDLILLLKDHLILHQVFSLIQPYGYDELKPLNQNLFFKTPFKEIYDNLSNYEDSYLGCFGFSYKRKNIRIAIENLTIMHRKILGYYPNALHFSTIVENSSVYIANEKNISNELLLVCLITNSFNPYFLMKLIDFYKSENYSYKEITRVYNKYSAIASEDKSISIPKKWISEFKLYILIRKIYPEAIFQFKSEWLGNQSIDIFIPNKNIAIEYQGIQHFEPIVFFGGEEGLNLRRKLDKLKQRKCINQKVSLIYWKFDEEINIINLQKKLKI